MPPATADTARGLSNQNPERSRLRADPTAWQRWGPYVSERAWGTVREDYSANGDAWNYLPHAHARSPTFGWSADGPGGVTCPHDTALTQTGVLAAGSWCLTVGYAKESPEDCVIELRAHNAGPATASLQVLPTLWFRNTWTWGITDTKPTLRAGSRGIVADHAVLGRRYLVGDGSPAAL